MGNITFVKDATTLCNSLWFIYLQSNKNETSQSVLFDFNLTGLLLLLP